MPGPDFQKKTARALAIIRESRICISRLRDAEHTPRPPSIIMKRRSRLSLAAALLCALCLPCAAAESETPAPPADAGQAPSDDLRMDFRKAAPGVFQAMLGLEKEVASGNLEKTLLTLVKLRASQINGCAHCLEMHSGEARGAGLPADKLEDLENWRESKRYSPRERAALAWTEALTLVAGHPVSDDAFAAARAEFGETELARLSLAIISINGWNRLNIAFRSNPESCPVPES